MTDKQKETIKNLDNDNLLDLFGNYHYKLVLSIVDEETANIHSALKAEILNRMERGRDL